MTEKTYTYHEIIEPSTAVKEVYEVTRSFPTAEGVDPARFQDGEVDWEGLESDVNNIKPGTVYISKWHEVCLYSEGLQWGSVDGAIQISQTVGPLPSTMVMGLRRGLFQYLTYLGGLSVVRTTDDQLLLGVRTGNNDLEGGRLNVVTGVLSYLDGNFEQGPIMDNLVTEYREEVGGTTAINSVQIAGIVEVPGKAPGMKIVGFVEAGVSFDELKANHDAAMGFYRTAEERFKASHDDPRHPARAALREHIEREGLPWPVDAWESDTLEAIPATGQSVRKLLDSEREMTDVGRVALETILKGGYLPLV